MVKSQSADAFMMTREMYLNQMRWDIFLAFWKAIGPYPIRVSVIYRVDTDEFRVTVFIEPEKEMVFRHSMLLHVDALVQLDVPRWPVLDAVAEDIVADFRKYSGV